MLRHVKRHLVPHKGNRHRPHLLRRDATRTIILGCIIFEFVLWITLTFHLINFIPFSASVLPGVLATLTNEQRVSNHLSDLRTNPVLDHAATLKAQDMAAKGYFAHTSPEGKTPWYWLNQVGYSYEYAGENLAINFSDSADVTNAWMNSPTHRANIEKAAYTEIGTGIATGMYQGTETIFVAQVYARPASAASVTNALATTQTNSKIAAKVNPKTDPIEREAISALPTQKLVAASQPEQTIVFEPQTEPTIVPGTPTILGMTSTTDSNSAIASASVQTQHRSNIFIKLLTAPRHFANLIFLAIGIVVTVVAIITIIVRIKKKQHPDLIINALVVIAVLLGLYFLNSYWAQTQIGETSSYIEFNRS